MTNTDKTSDISINALVPLGITPSLATQFLWALHRHDHATQGELRVITTAVGRETADSLFGGEIDPLITLNKELREIDASNGSDRLPEWVWHKSKKPKYHKSNIEVFSNATGHPVRDITKSEHFDIVADNLTTLVQKMVTPPNSPPLYVLISGGRASMAAVIHQAMSVYGRECDRIFELPANETAMDQEMSRKHKNWKSFWLYPSIIDKVSLGMHRHFSLVNHDFPRYGDFLQIPADDGDTEPPSEASHRPYTKMVESTLSSMRDAHLSDRVMVLAAPQADTSNKARCSWYFMPRSDVGGFIDNWPESSLNSSIDKPKDDLNTLQLRPATLWLLLLCFSNTMHPYRKEGFSVHNPDRHAYALALLYRKLAHRPRSMDKLRDYFEQKDITLTKVSNPGPRAVGSIDLDINTDWTLKDKTAVRNCYDDKAFKDIVKPDLTTFLEPLCHWPDWLKHSDDLPKELSCGREQALAERAKNWKRLFNAIQSHFVIENLTGKHRTLLRQFLPANGITFGKNSSNHCRVNPNRVFFIDRTGGVIRDAQGNCSLEAIDMTTLKDGDNDYLNKPFSGFPDELEPSDQRYRTVLHWIQQDLWENQLEEVDTTTAATA